ncbi:LLM class flavin-dependent oxidoreductase [Streptomyces sp. NPDC101191]|uniref:LLM class flavin-dependent oxidoreductase n=1 Tax=Streptomyces sp. NPDC101191 TaxID=3366126 RepID=UPI003827A474
MQLGVNVPNFGPGTDPGLLRAWARTVEDLGYDLLMVSDHVAVTPDVAERYPEPFYEPFTTLSWLAGLTTRVRLGTTVLVLPYRHPLLVARMVANLDRLSAGRLVLGVGVGWAREEFAALGVPYTARGRLTDEHLEALREALRTTGGARGSGTEPGVGPGAVEGFGRGSASGVGPGAAEGLGRSASGVEPGVGPGAVEGLGRGSASGTEPGAGPGAVEGLGWSASGVEPRTGGGPGSPVPIWVGGNSEAGIRRAQKYGDAWHPLRGTVDWLRSVVERHDLPGLAPRIALRLTDAPVEDPERPAGVGTLDQILDDLDRLRALGAHTVVLDPYQGDPEETRRPHAAWQALAAVADHRRTAP